MDYSLLAEQIRSFAETDPHWMPLLANVSALIMDSVPDLNWAGFYLLRGETLVLGPFQGKPACIHIPVGKGVCGTAAERGETVRVANVHEFPGHIACDGASNSEIVVPVFAREEAAGDGTPRCGGVLIGVLDLDSPLTGRFSEEDQAGLEKCVRALEEAAEWEK